MTREGIIEEQKGAHKRGAQNWEIIDQHKGVRPGVGMVTQRVTSFVVKTITPPTDTDKLNLVWCHGVVVAQIEQARE